MKSKEKEPEHAWPSHRESPQRGLCESHGTVLHPSTSSCYLTIKIISLIEISIECSLGFTNITQNFLGKIKKVRKGGKKMSL